MGAERGGAPLEAGADALELNIYDVPVDISVSGQEIEQRYLTVLSAVRNQEARVKRPRSIEPAQYSKPMPG